MPRYGRSRRGDHVVELGNDQSTAAFGPKHPTTISNMMSAIHMAQTPIRKAAAYALAVSSGGSGSPIDLM